MDLTGKKAPVFTLPASNNQNVSLSDFLGKKYIILYFYPKDDTPGCTTEACGFRDTFKDLIEYDAVILGVSPDPVVKHQTFIEKFNLPFLLLSDEDKKVCRKYSVWVEKNMYGRKYMGVARETFLIDKKGRIIKHFKKVKPKNHPDDIMKAFGELSQY